MDPFSIRHRKPRYIFSQDPRASKNTKTNSYRSKIGSKVIIVPDEMPTNDNRVRHTSQVDKQYWITRIYNSAITGNQTNVDFVVDSSNNLYLLSLNENTSVKSFLLHKFNYNGEHQWSIAYGGNAPAKMRPSSIIIHEDFLYICSYVQSATIDGVSGTHYYIFKLNMDGDIQWQYLDKSVRRTSSFLLFESIEQIDSATKLGEPKIDIDSDGDIRLTNKLAYEYRYGTAILDVRRATGVEIKKISLDGDVLEDYSFGFGSLGYGSSTPYICCDEDGVYTLSPMPGPSGQACFLFVEKVSGDPLTIRLSANSGVLPVGLSVSQNYIYATIKKANGPSITYKYNKNGTLISKNQFSVSPTFINVNYSTDELLIGGSSSSISRYTEEFIWSNSMTINLGSSGIPRIVLKNNSIYSTFLNGQSSGFYAIKIPSDGSRTGSYDVGGVAAEYSSISSSTSSPAAEYVSANVVFYPNSVFLSGWQESFITSESAYYPTKNVTYL